MRGATSRVETVFYTRERPSVAPVCVCSRIESWYAMCGEIPFHIAYDSFPLYVSCSFSMSFGHGDPNFSGITITKTPRNFRLQFHVGHGSAELTTLREHRVVKSPLHNPLQQKVRQSVFVHRNKSVALAVVVIFTE